MLKKLWSPKKTNLASDSFAKFNHSLADIESKSLYDTLKNHKKNIDEIGQHLLSGNAENFPAIADDPKYLISAGKDLAQLTDGLANFIDDTAKLKYDFTKLNDSIDIDDPVLKKLLGKDALKSDTCHLDLKNFLQNAKLWQLYVFKAWLRTHSRAVDTLKRAKLSETKIKSPSASDEFKAYKNAVDKLEKKLTDILERIPQSPKVFNEYDKDNKYTISYLDYIGIHLATNPDDFDYFTRKGDNTDNIAQSCYNRHHPTWTTQFLIKLWKLKSLFLNVPLRKKILISVVLTTVVLAAIVFTKGSILAPPVVLFIAKAIFSLGAYVSSSWSSALTFSGVVWVGFLTCKKIGCFLFSKKLLDFFKKAYQTAQDNKEGFNSFKNWKPDAARPVQPLDFKIFMDPKSSPLAESANKAHVSQLQGGSKFTSCLPSVSSKINLPKLPKFLSRMFSSKNSFHSNPSEPESNANSDLNTTHGQVSTPGK